MYNTLEVNWKLPAKSAGQVTTLWKIPLKRLAWPLRKDDTHKSRSVNDSLKRQIYTTEK